jgi:hypothetical protein
MHAKYASRHWLYSEPIADIFVNNAVARADCGAAARARPAGCFTPFAIALIVAERTAERAATLVFRVAADPITGCAARAVAARETTGCAAATAPRAGAALAPTLSDTITPRFFVVRFARKFSAVCSRVSASATPRPVSACAADAVFAVATPPRGFGLESARSSKNRPANITKGTMKTFLISFNDYNIKRKIRQEQFCVFFRPRPQGRFRAILTNFHNFYKIIYERKG